MTTIAFECYADRDFVEFLAAHGQLQLKFFHAYGQGEVVRSVLVRGACKLGIVDEDPLATHHRARDETELTRETDSVQLRRRRDRHLVVVKPDLERCFLRSMQIAGLESRLPPTFSQFHAALNVERSVKHGVFRSELEHLYAASRRRKLSTLVTDVIDLVRPLV